MNTVFEIGSWRVQQSTRETKNLCSDYGQRERIAYSHQHGMIIGVMQRNVQQSRNERGLYLVRTPCTGAILAATATLVHVHLPWHRHLQHLEAREQS